MLSSVGSPPAAVSAAVARVLHSVEVGARGGGVPPSACSHGHPRPEGGESAAVGRGAHSIEVGACSHEQARLAPQTKPQENRTPKNKNKNKKVGSSGLCSQKRLRRTASSSTGMY